MFSIMIAFITIFITFLSYVISKKIYKHFPSPFTLPLFIGTVLLISILTISEVSYETYMIGGQWLEKLLGPAVVALAFPLYKHKSILLKYFPALLISVTSGAILGVISGVQLSKLFGLEEILIYSLVPKSVTTPVAMEVATNLGGIPALAAIFVMIAGVSGAIFGPFLLKILRINHFLGKGVGLGCASHAIGTARALEYGELEGAISTVAMTLSAVIVSILGPLIFLVLI